MVNYAEGKIYKIISLIEGNNDIYIGSTTVSLANRLAEHVSQYKRYRDGKSTKYISSYKIIELGNYDIILIEEVKCDNKSQLHAREAYHIKNEQCVNKVIPKRTKKEYANDNYEKIKEYKTEYRNKNKDKIREKRKVYDEKNKDKKEAYVKQYRQENKDKKKETDKKYQQENIEKIRQYRKQYYLENKNLLDAKCKERYQRQKEIKNIEFNII